MSGRLLTDTQRADLTRTLAASLRDDATGDDVQDLSDAVHAVIPFTTLNIQTAATWLLASDDAATLDAARGEG